MGGTKRRFEYLGEKNGAIIVDDYAHHPKEIQATLQATRQWYAGKRIIAVFQPHTYSRTKILLSDFAKSFDTADVVVLTDIYASARESDTRDITGETLVSHVREHHNSVVYAKTKDAVFATLAKLSITNDVILFMGAGDIYTWGKEYLNNK